MPSGPDHLREKFMKSCPTCGRCIDDGIDTAEQIIKHVGGTIDRGCIDLPAKYIGTDDVPDDLRDAVQYLLEEWDYAMGSPDLPSAKPRPQGFLPRDYPGLPPITPGVVIEKLRAGIVGLLEKFEHDVQPGEAGWDAIENARIALQYIGELERTTWPASLVKSNPSLSEPPMASKPPAPSADTSPRATENPTDPSSAASS